MRLRRCLKRKKADSIAISALPRQWPFFILFCKYLKLNKKYINTFCFSIQHINFYVFFRKHSNFTSKARNDVFRSDTHPNPRTHTRGLFLPRRAGCSPLSRDGKTRHKKGREMDSAFRRPRSCGAPGKLGAYYWRRKTSN